MSQFIHLHTHSHYSLLNALPKVPELVRAAKNFGMEALALTDSGNLYGALQFYKICKKENLKPIIGVDAYVAARTRIDREPGIDNRRARLVLLAKNMEGYRNLLRLVTVSHLEGFYYKPRVDHELLRTHARGLIAIIPSFSGETTLALKNHDTEGAKQTLALYKDIYGEEDVYIELTHHPEIEGHEALMRQVRALSKETGTPLVAAHDTYYLSEDDRRARETMVRIQTGADASGAGAFDDSPEDFSFISPKQAEDYFKDTPEALENTGRIAEKCNLELTLGSWVFPELKLPKNEAPESALKKLAYGGIEKRGLKQTEEVEKRVEHELGIINGKGYAPYFLVVADLMRFARENNILTTVRGSGAGSLVAYLCGITNVDPLEYLLPFERFLNPHRPSPPDFDMDFADNRRDEVIAYAKGKYGEDKVAQIGTFGTMMARAAVRDVARALGHPYNVGDRLAKLIPFGSQGFPMTIQRAMEVEPELKKLYKDDKDAKDIIDLAQKIEGCARHISVHAAGVVIAPTPLTDYLPLQHDPKGGGIITQYNMYSVEDAGLLKFDFLGIKNLSILADAVERVEKATGKKIDIENIPLDDKKTYEMLARGETMGLFQLGGSGMTRFLKELRPSRIQDINAMVALYRPGPMKSIPQYIERKHNPSLVTYLDPRMKDILSQSYGVITYQEDVLMIAIHVAGYSWLEADKLRKAMGKKIPAEMEAQREKLIESAMKKGLSKDKSEKLWKLIEPFAAYGFNKAHAACYGKVAYQTAYMKANYPAIYMASVLTADAGDVDKVAESINECARMNILVLPPDINESQSDFTVVEQNDTSRIRFGLKSIKNFGEGIGNAIIEERGQNGKYKTLRDFLERIHDRNLNKKSLEALIKCGALDQFGERGAMLAGLDTLLTYNREFAQDVRPEESLFAALPETKVETELVLEEVPPTPLMEKLSWEKELLGLYVSGHPLDQYQEKIKGKVKAIAELKENLKDGMPATVAGIVEEMKPIFTKSGDKMAFMKIADYGGNIEVVVFPRIYTQYRELLEPQKCVALKGRISGRNGEQSMIVEAVKAL